MQILTDLVSFFYSQRQITQHKRFALLAHPNFCFAKTSFMLESLSAIAPNEMEAI